MNFLIWVVAFALLICDLVFNPFGEWDSWICIILIFPILFLPGTFGDIPGVGKSDDGEYHGDGW